jgi:hypothetical protein
VRPTVGTPQLLVATAAAIPGGVGGATTIGRVALVLTISDVLTTTRSSTTCTSSILPPPSIDTERSILASAVERGAGRFDGLLIPQIRFRDAQFYRDGHCFPLCKKRKT